MESVHSELSLRMDEFQNKMKSQIERISRLYLAYSIEWSVPEFFGQNSLKLDDLQKKVETSGSDVQRYLSLGWIRVCEILAENGEDMNNLMNLWHEFLPFLRQLEFLYLKLEKILALWEKVLYLLLLYLSFSEFPNWLRPPCTTMPWTIWPALVILWGVCWMFYEGELSSACEGQCELPTSGSVARQFEDIGPVDPYGLVDYDLFNISFNEPAWTVPYFGAPNLEQHLTRWVFGPETTPNPAKFPDFIPHLSTSGEIAATYSFSSHLTTGTIPRGIGGGQLEAIQSRALVPLISPVTVQPKDNPIRSSQGSKHSQIEKYFCTYPDCIYSQPSSGFKRKDHLDQHLRGKHKQTSVQRLRAKPKATDALSISNPTITSDVTGAPSQTKKKRKRRSEDESGGSNFDRLETELAEEQRLRRLVEEDNQVLRQKLGNYEQRMEKYEERLDRMMDLLAEH